MTDTFTTIAGQEIVWQDAAGTTHLCEGSDLAPVGKRPTRLVWTRCAGAAATTRAGSLDVPAGCAWLRRPGDFITCKACVDAREGAVAKVFV